MAKMVAGAEAVPQADGAVAARQASAEEMAEQRAARSRELRKLAACAVAQQERRGGAQQPEGQVFEFQALGALPVEGAR